MKPTLSIILTAAVCLAGLAWVAQPPPPVAAAAAVSFEELSQSVYAVKLLVEESGDETGLGTAFHVGRGVFVTSWHVVQRYRSLADGERIVLRAPFGRRSALEVANIDPHPGYAEFEATWAEYEPVENAAGWPPVLPAGIPGDVALIFTRGDELPPPLEIASPEALATLRPGQPVCYIGYPTEGVRAVAPWRPVPFVIAGSLTRITDFLGNPLGNLQDEASVALLSVDLAIAGGASGSPLFDASGRVVGILHAGSRVGRGPGGERSWSNFGFALRADTILELLQGTASNGAEARRESWRRCLASTYESGSGLYRRAALGQLLPAWNAYLTERRGHGHRTKLIAVAEGALKGDHGRLAQPVPLRFPDRGDFLVVAFSTRRDRRLELTIQSDPGAGTSVEIASTSPSAVQHAVLHVDKEGMDVNALVATADEETGYLIYTYAAEPASARPARAVDEAPAEGASRGVHLGIGIPDRDSAFADVRLAARSTDSDPGFDATLVGFTLLVQGARAAPPADGSEHVRTQNLDAWQRIGDDSLASLPSAEWESLKMAAQEDRVAIEYLVEITPRKGRRFRHIWAHVEEGVPPERWTQGRWRALAHTLDDGTGDGAVGIAPIEIGARLRVNLGRLIRELFGQRRERPPYRNAIKYTRREMTLHPGGVFSFRVRARFYPGSTLYLTRDGRGEEGHELVPAEILPAPADLGGPGVPRDDVESGHGPPVGHSRPRAPSRV